MNTKQRTNAKRNRANNNGETADKDPNLTAIRETLEREMQISSTVETLRGYGGVYVDCACAVELLFETQRNLHNAGTAVLRVVKALAALGDREQTRKPQQRSRRAAVGRAR